MAKFCNQCGHEKVRNVGRLHICDTVKLSDGRVVHASRIRIGGDLHDQLGDDLKVVHRNISAEMREQMRKGRL